MGTVSSSAVAAAEGTRGHVFCFFVFFPAVSGPEPSKPEVMGTKQTRRCLEAGLVFRSCETHAAEG